VHMRPEGIPAQTAPGVLRRQCHPRGGAAEAPRRRQREPDNALSSVLASNASGSK
jgi:hypothetical protein